MLQNHGYLVECCFFGGDMFEMKYELNRKIQNTAPQAAVVLTVNVEEEMRYVFQVNQNLIILP